MKTAELIARLSKEAPKPRLKPPAYFGTRLGFVLAAYGVGTQSFLHLRPDLIAQFNRPMFSIEIFLLAALTISSTIAAILSMYPDNYQKPHLLKLPYMVFGALIAFILSQLAIPHDARMVMPDAKAHGIECALCIASVALVPSGVIFGLLRKGAIVNPLRAGSFAILAASGIGCLTLRLAEANDSLMHLVTWHYLPTLLFASLGALLGKSLLKW